jgi:hypothetical protein
MGGIDMVPEPGACQVLDALAARAVADPAGWRRMHQEAGQLQSGARQAGPTLAEVLARRGIQL